MFPVKNASTNEQIEIAKTQKQTRLEVHRSSIHRRLVHHARNTLRFLSFPLRASELQEGSHEKMERSSGGKIEGEFTDRERNEKKGAERTRGERNKTKTKGREEREEG